MKKTLLFVAIGAASGLTLILNGCSKKDSSSGYTMKQLAGTYKLTAATYAAGGINGDYLQTLDDCQKDDLLTLSADSVATYTDAGVVCTPDGSSVGKWYVSGNLLIQVNNDQNDTATIKSFNGTALSIVLSGEYLSIPVTITSTLTKQ